MFFYICFLIAFNLCVGYALGAYIGTPWGTPGRGGRRLAPRTEEADPPAEPAPGEPVASRSSIELPETSDAALLAGLASFQQQIAEIGSELENSRDDPEAFGEHARHLQQANHDYLEAAQDIQQRDPASGAASGVAEGIDRIGSASKDVDELIEAGLEDAAKRDQVLTATGELSEAAGQVHNGLEQYAAELKELRDPASGLGVLDGLLAEIDTLLCDGGAEQLRTAVVVQMDEPPAGTDPEFAAAVRAKLGEIIGGQVTDPGSACRLTEAQYLLLPEDTEFNEIAEQVEALRKQIEATCFVRDGQELGVTVSCAIADMPGAQNREALLARLEAALAETANQGVNRTFHHDGSFAAVVEGVGAEAAPQTIDV